MNEEFGPFIVTLEDDEGNEYELELLDTIEFNGATYKAFTPIDPENEEEMEIVILKETLEEDEDMFITVDDEDELDAVYERFMERLVDEEEEEE